jgi:hypothetical protein
MRGKPSKLPVGTDGIVSGCMRMPIFAHLLIDLAVKVTLAGTTDMLPSDVPYVLLREQMGRANRPSHGFPVPIPEAGALLLALY